MDEQKNEPADWAEQTKKNTVRLAAWTFAWVASMALAAFGPRSIWNFETVPTILFVIINLGIGFGMILATKRHLNGLDELHQKIFRDAAVLTLGVGLVFGLSYELLEDIKLIPFQPEIPHLVMLMCLTFMTGMIGGQRKYR